MRFNDVSGRTVVISNQAVNGYTIEKVLLAKQYLEEIGGNRRNFPVGRLVEMYNTLKGTHDNPKGCRPCAMAKYYNGINTYYTYGKLTLISTGKATEEDFMPKKEAPKVEAAVNEVPEPQAVEVKEEKVIDIPGPELSAKAEKPKKADAPKKKAGKK